MTLERHLDPSFVEIAERARNTNNTIFAAEIAGNALGFPDHPLTPQEIQNITLDQDRLAIVACLARIQVDSLKTSANKSMFPGQTLGFLERAAFTIDLIYLNPEFRKEIEPVSEDHLGRRHYFAPEMARDRSKVLQAAAVLFTGLQSETLYERGEKILNDTLDSLPIGHPTKPLIAIELGLLQARRGVPLNEDEMLDNFREIILREGNDNPERVATVASWFAVWGKKYGLQEMASFGNSVFGRIVKDHPEWAYMTEKEKKKMLFEQFRRIAFKLITPVSTKQAGRQDLYLSFVKERTGCSS